jgi:hypothetical protein
MTHIPILIWNEDVKKLYSHNFTSLLRNFMSSINHYHLQALQSQKKYIGCFHMLYTLLVTTVVIELEKFNTAKTKLRHCTQSSSSPFSVSS